VYTILQSKNHILVIIISPKCFIVNQAAPNLVLYVFRVCFILNLCIFVLYKLLTEKMI